MDVIAPALRHVIGFTVEKYTSVDLAHLYLSAPSIACVLTRSSSQLRRSEMDICSRLLSRVIDRW